MEEGGLKRVLCWIFLALLGGRTVTGNSVHLDVVGMSEVNTTVCWRDTLVVKCTVTGSLHNATVTKHGRHLLYINGSLVGAELQHAVVHLQGEERFVVSIEKFGLEMGTSILSCLYTANGLNSSSNSIKLYVTNCSHGICPCNQKEEIIDQMTAAVVAAAATTLVVGVIVLTSVIALIGTVRKRKRRKTVNLLQESGNNNALPPEDLPHSSNTAKCCLLTRMIFTQTKVAGSTSTPDHMTTPVGFHRHTIQT